MIQKLDHKEEGFKRVYENDRWTLALKNAGPANRKEAVKCLECHNETDEIFILLRGNATVMEGLVESGKIKCIYETKMEVHKPYVIHQGCWHNTWMEDGAEFAIIENVETSYDNTDVLEFDQVRREEKEI